MVFPLLAWPFFPGVVFSIICLHYLFEVIWFQLGSNLVFEIDQKSTRYRPKNQSCFLYVLMLVFRQIKNWFKIKHESSRGSMLQLQQLIFIQAIPDQAPTSTYITWKRSVNQTWTGASSSRRSMLQLQQLIFIQAMPDQAPTSTYVKWKRSVIQTWTDRPEHAPASTTYWCWLFYCTDAGFRPSRINQKLIQDLYKNSQ